MKYYGPADPSRAMLAVINHTAKRNLNKLNREQNFKKKLLVNKPKIVS